MIHLTSSIRKNVSYLKKDQIISDPCFDETVLIEKLKQKDRKAMDDFIDRTLPKIQSFAYYMLGDHHEAEDICQEVFLKFWKKLPDWIPQQPNAYHHGRKNRQAKLSTWLYKVALTSCIDYKRRKQKVDIPDLFKTFFLYSDQTASKPAQTLIEKKQTVQELRLILGKLKTRYKTALLLKYEQELSQVEAAEILGISIHAFESLLSRARKSMKKILIESGYHQGNIHE